MLVVVVQVRHTGMAVLVEEAQQAVAAVVVVDLADQADQHHLAAVVAAAGCLKAAIQ